MARLDKTLPNPALALARRRLLEVNLVLLRKPNAQTRPRWERLKAALERQIDSLKPSR